MLFQSLDLTLKESFKIYIKISISLFLLRNSTKGFMFGKGNKNLVEMPYFLICHQKYSGIFSVKLRSWEKVNKFSVTVCDSACAPAALAQLFCKSDFWTRCQESNRKNNLKVNQNELLLCLSICHMCCTVWYE